jgi:Mg-chelatase subunit ChlD
MWLLGLLVGVVGLTVWRGRRLPLSGWRRVAVIGARAGSVALLCLALPGAVRQRTVEQPRRLVYLVDVSDSLEPAQRDWIARRLASLDALRPASQERAVVAFGGAPRLAAPFGRSPLEHPDAVAAMLAGASVPRGATNLEAALLSVPGLLSSAGPAAGAWSEPRVNVILLTDGWETVGNLRGTLGTARRLGLEVYPAAPPLAEPTPAIWQELAVPPAVQLGASVPVRLILAHHSDTPRAGRVTVDLHGVPVTRERVTIRPGWQVLSVSVPAIGRGTMALDVRLEIPSASVQERRRAYVEVEGPPQVLLVSDRLAETPALATALRRRELGIALLRPEELPTEPERLAPYDAAVLFNLPKSALAPAAAEALGRYVEEAGGGLVLVGLGGELAEELGRDSPLDALSPLRVEPRGLQEAQRRLCIVLLIDRSASMLGPRIAATKRAAVALVNELMPEDLVGVLAFDTQPYVVAEVQPAGQVDQRLVEKLATLRSSGGTDVLPALTAAADRLELTGASVRHIILLSDGNTPFHRPLYRQFIERAVVSHITVSTIGIGSAFVNEDYLQWLARSTGGAFYPMRRLEELPTLVVRDAEQAMARLPFAEGLFRPSPTASTDWFAEIGEWPRLRGYLTATARPGASVDLTVNGGSGEDPLLARWRAGRGRVVAFASDADRRWSPEWIRWPGYEGVWAQIVRWAMRPRWTEELFVWVDDSGSVPLLMVEGGLQQPTAELIPAETVLPASPGAARQQELSRPADASGAIPLSLIQTGTWRWQAALEQVPSGWYQLALEAFQADAPGPEREATGQPALAGGPDGTVDTAMLSETPAIHGATPSEVTPPHNGGDGHEVARGGPPPARGPVFVTRWVQVGQPTASGEMTGRPPHTALLDHLAQATGGRVDAPDRALLPATTVGRVTEQGLPWWLPLVIVLLLAEIALRGPSLL